MKVDSWDRSMVLGSDRCLVKTVLGICFLYVNYVTAYC